MFRAPITDNKYMSNAHDTIPAHETEIEFADSDEDCTWRMRVRCLGDSFSNFVILKAQRDDEPAITTSPQTLFVLSDLGKWLKKYIQAEIKRNWREKI